MVLGVWHGERRMRGKCVCKNAVMSLAQVGMEKKCFKTGTILSGRCSCGAFARKYVKGARCHCRTPCFPKVPKEMLVQAEAARGSHCIKCNKCQNLTQLLETKKPKKTRKTKKSASRQEHYRRSNKKVKSKKKADADFSSYTSRLLAFKSKQSAVLRHLQNAILSSEKMRIKEGKYPSAANQQALLAAPKHIETARKAVLALKSMQVPVPVNVLSKLPAALRQYARPEALQDSPTEEEAKKGRKSMKEAPHKKPALHHTKLTKYKAQLLAFKQHQAKLTKQLLVTVRDSQELRSRVAKAPTDANQHALSIAQAKLVKLSKKAKSLTKVSVPQNIFSLLGGMQKYAQVQMPKHAETVEGGGGGDLLDEDRLD